MAHFSHDQGAFWASIFTPLRQVYVGLSIKSKAAGPEKLVAHPGNGMKSDLDAERIRESIHEGLQMAREKHGFAAEVAEIHYLDVNTPDYACHGYCAYLVAKKLTEEGPDAFEQPAASASNER